MRKCGRSKRFDFFGKKTDNHNDAHNSAFLERRKLVKENRRPRDLKKAFRGVFRMRKKARSSPRGKDNGRGIFLVLNGLCHFDFRT